VSVRGGQCRYDHLVDGAEPGLHTLHLSLPITQENYTRTIWSRDAYGLPSFTNLYGAHPVYINQITGSNSTSASSHGVFLLNSNGMDVKFPESGKYLEAFSTCTFSLDLPLQRLRGSMSRLLVSRAREGHVARPLEVRRS
jgi:hypothetical protein